jgi:hypothetical protein
MLNKNRVEKDQTVPCITKFGLARVSYSVDNPFQPKQHVTDTVSTYSALVVEGGGAAAKLGGGAADSDPSSQC